MRSRRPRRCSRVPWRSPRDPRNAGARRAEELRLAASSSAYRKTRADVSVSTEGSCTSPSRTRRTRRSSRIGVGPARMAVPPEGRPEAGAVRGRRGIPPALCREGWRSGAVGRLATFSGYPLVNPTTDRRPLFSTAPPHDASLSRSPGRMGPRWLRDKSGESGQVDPTVGRVTVKRWCRERGRRTLTSRASAARSGRRRVTARCQDLRRIGTRWLT